MHKQARKARRTIKSYHHWGYVVGCPCCRVAQTESKWGSKRARRRLDRWVIEELIEEYNEDHPSSDTHPNRSLRSCQEDLEID